MAVLYVVVFHTLQSYENPSMYEGEDLDMLRQHWLVAKNKIK